MNYIFLHGLGQSVSSYDEVLKHIDVKEVYVPNIFNLNNKEMNYDNLYNSFFKYCNDKDGDINLCGLSLGGILSLNYCLDNPEKVKSLILIGGQFKMPKYLMKFQNIIFRLMPEKIFNKIGLNRNDMIKLTSSTVNLNFEDKLENIKCPTLIICGSKDKANLSASIKMSKYIKKSKFIIIKNGVHELNKSNPTELSNIINEFYKTIQEI